VPVIKLAEDMRRTAEAQGEEGRAWLAALPCHIAAVSAAWSLTIGEVLHGGKNAYVTRVRANHGTLAVLKIAPPWMELVLQVRTIEAADGHGYVRLYAHDLHHNAVLLEPLGPTLTTVSPSIEDSLDVLAWTLLQAWQVPRSAAPIVVSGGDKASQLIPLITDLWVRLGSPCSLRLRDRAIRYAEQRAAAFDADTSVVCHGDPHPNNALVVAGSRPAAESGFVFIDPDGFVCDRAYDLGVVIRGWSEVVLASEDPVALVRTYANRLAAVTSVDDEEIWQWSFIERVSTGLFLQWKGHQREGRAFLDSGEVLLP
jgi:streptomycin 6-kinase